ncbi:MAG: hypothetical protein GX111_06965 [Clostridiales bacterium]|jgi:hypothetical protein|nr:hypothetical protein [Clostridiales bacterium]
MKYAESYTEFDAAQLELLKNAVPASFAENLKAGGIDAVLPEDRELELKVKYDVNAEGGSFSLKLIWNNEDAEVDNDDDDEDDED